MSILPKPVKGDSRALPHPTLAKLLSGGRSLHIRNNDKTGICEVILSPAPTARSTELPIRHVGPDFYEVLRAIELAFDLAHDPAEGSR